MSWTYKNGMSTCLECNKEGDGHMVSCSDCKEKCHRDCAQVLHSEEESGWRCKSCLAMLTKAPVAQEEDMLQTPAHKGANEAGSVRSVSTKASSKKSRQIQAELDMVNEELAVIAEKNKILQQHELLIKKRRSLLQQHREIDSSSTSSEASIRETRCNDWVQCRKVSAVAECQNKVIGDTTLPHPQPQNICNTTATVECVQALQEMQLSDNCTRPPRGETVNASQWAPGMVPLSSTIDTNLVARDANLTQPNSNVSTFRLTPEHIAARKGLAKDLPKFTGKPEEWTLFLATYEQTTQLCGFSDEENLIRLRHALDGAARNSVKSLLLNVACVPQILSTLRMKFGRPELIIDILLNQIRDMPSPKESRLETIVDFAIEVQNVCATMKAAGMTNYLNNPELEQELVCKLPGLLAAFWGMHKATLVTSTLENFSEWLFQLAQGANSVLLPSSSTKMHRRSGNVNAHSEAVPTKLTSGAKCVACRSCCKKVALCDRFKKMKRSEKWKIIRKHNLCKICLLPHYPRPCSSGLKCNIGNCNMDHHPILHRMASPSVEVMPSVSVNCNAHYTYNSNPILFRILPVTLYGNGVKISTHAFFDDGSSLSLIDEDLFKVLNIAGERQPLCMRWTSNMLRNEDDSIVTNFEMSGTDSRKRFLLKDVHTVKKLDLPLQTIDAKKLQQQYEHLRDIPLVSYVNATPRILIGLNNTRAGQCLKTKEGGENEPTAEKTRLGWMVKGIAAPGRPLVEALYYHSFSQCNCDTKSADELLNVVRNFIVNDNYIDMAYDKKSVLSFEDKLAIQQLEKLTHRVGDHFVTGLLWRCPETLPDGSFFMAKRRATILQTKMENDASLYNVLQSKMTDYISKGYARKLLPSELQVERCWYMPVFPVVSPNKPGKIRLVWVAAAKVDAVSLNSMLLKGPGQLTSLVAVIRKFRQKRVAIGRDIAEVFHQVRIRKKDQQYQRFLWQDTTASRLETYIMTVMTFRASCSPSCAQYVKNKNANDFRKQYPQATRCIIENHYVDEMLDSVDTEEEAIQLARDVQFVHSQAGFHIRNWVSNSSKVLEAPSTTTVNQISFNIDGVCAAEKVLGMWWDMTTDTFVDASEDAYAAVSYLRCTNGHDVNISLLGCKTKVAPIKTQSIPRLELQGAVLGARLAKSLGESLSLSINKNIFWTDSSTVLSWLNSDQRRYKQFVAFRVSEVLDLSELSSWRWVPTNENVADEATKWKKSPEFTQDSRWLNGPSFLKLGESEWPKRNSENPSESEKELRACYVGHHRQQNNETSIFLTAADRIANWKRLVRVIAKVLQSIRVWKNRNGNKTIDSAELTHKDICEGEKLLFKEAQKVAPMDPSHLLKELQMVSLYEELGLQHNNWRICFGRDPGNPRNCWPKGIVQAVHTGVDGQVRSATIRTSAGVYVRPATMIAVLDVRSSTEMVDPMEDIPGGSVNKFGSNVFPFSHK